ncbi:protein ANTAGONIST OF LIKE HETEROCHROMATIN PROTEIN 1-like isoform X2 [Homarus americanus]|uniref:protein ANTAGONIST OF LIKE HETEROCHROMATIN PROTEIN 1-like isoform X2 n=1 Tax=Homarus americanus TaxID=6706 RepID=UPI001C479072|nr:protein ANTAGONIST OF LIKE HETEROCHROMATIN PROTEIN 1-like isoform X2 [Homarus americanus]
MKDIVKFPAFKVDKHTVNAKRIKSLLLRLALKENTAYGERRIYIQLPEESDHCNHKTPGRKRPRRSRKLKDNTKTECVPCLDSDLNDSQFLNTFRVTKSLYQFLVGEWQKEVVEKMVEAGVPVAELEQFEQHVLAALYYLGSAENIASASSRFKIKTIDFMDSILKFSDFLIRQQEKYLTLPTLEERITIAEVIKHDSGFPGVFGAMDAALVQMQTPLSNEEQDYCYNNTPSGSKCAFVLQFIVDHRLHFRDIHLDAPTTGTRIQVFQESGAWFHLQSLTSSETHIVAPAVYPLAPAIMTPHMTEVLSYQEALFNENHREAHKLAVNAMTIFKSRFKRMQKLDRHVDNNRKFVKAACILHNIALMHEDETVLDELSMEYNSEADEDGWHNVGLDEVVAEFGILGGEEKRHYLTTVMPARSDASLSYVQFPPNIDT